MNLYDASALLAFAYGEPGADVVAEALADGGRCSAVNWSEVAQKLRSRGSAWHQLRVLILHAGVQVEPVLPADAELAAAMWEPGSGLSLADRLCLATAQRLNATVWTADSAWGTTNGIRQIR